MDAAPELVREQAPPSRASATLAIALALAALAAAALYCFGPLRIHAIDPGNAAHREGHSYTVALDGLLPSPALRQLMGLQPDTNEQPQASGLRLLEQGAPIGPAHTVHAEIGSKGAGRYSHWGDALVFSTSHNSDPRSNGRRYEVAYGAAPAWWVVIILAAAAMAATRRTYRGQRALAIAFWTGFALLAIYANWVFAALVSAPLVHPDSGGYLFWSLVRTWGYPLLLHAYHGVFGTWEYLPLVQLNLLLAGVGVLAAAVARVCGYVAAWILVALIYGAGMLLASAAELVTEAPFGAFAMGHLGFTILFMTRGSRLLGLLAGLCLAAAIAIKSVGVVLLGPVLLFVAFLPGLRGRMLLLVALPAAAAWLAPGLYNLTRYGAFETSHAGGFALSGHVAWAIHPQPGSAVAAEARLVEVAIQPVTARRPSRFDSVFSYVDYTAREYNSLLWERMVPELTRYYAARRPPESCTWDGLDRGGCVSTHVVSVNRTLLQLSREAIAAHPRAYLYHVLAHDYGMWRDLFGRVTDFVLITDEHANSLPSNYDPSRNMYLTLMAPLPEFRSADHRRAVVSRLQDSPAKRLLDLATFRAGVEDLLLGLKGRPWILFGLGLLASLAVLALRRATPAVRACCYCALCLNAYMLGTALAQPSLVRYAMAVQGLAAALLVLSAWSAGSAARNVYHRLRPRTSA